MDKREAHRQGHLFYKMDFEMIKRFKRTYVCPDCNYRCGLEMNSSGKVPYCIGTDPTGKGLRHEFLIKERYDICPLITELPFLTDDIGFYQLQSIADPRAKLKLEARYERRRIEGIALNDLIALARGFEWNPIYTQPEREPVNKLAASMFWGSPKISF